MQWLLVVCLWYLWCLVLTLGQVRPPVQRLQLGGRHLQHDAQEPRAQVVTAAGRQGGASGRGVRATLQLSDKFDEFMNLLLINILDLLMFISQSFRCSGVEIYNLSIYWVFPHC